MSLLGGLGEAGLFLVGDTTTQPGWLHTCLSSISPQGDFFCLAKGQNFLLYRCGWSCGRLELKLEHKAAVSVLQEDEEITCLAVCPVLSQGRIQVVSHFTVIGFNSGIVRVYTESGQLVIQKSFHASAVKQIRFQCMPEGKHCTNILYTQTVQELLVVYETVVVTVAAVDLVEAVARNTKELASTLARGLETAMLINLKAQKQIIRDQNVVDCGSFVLTNTSYNQYFQMTMQGGIVDERHRPVSTKPHFLTVGKDPFLQYNEKGVASAGELAQNMVSTVKSGFLRVASGALGSIWSSQAVETEPKDIPDPQSNLAISHSLKDSGRDGLEVLISPNKMYSVVKDSQNRVLLIDNHSRAIVQMWRGYHRCQMGWSLATTKKMTEPAEAQGSTQDVAMVLILYLPRRGLIEVWSPEQKVKVTEFNVSKYGSLLLSGGVCLDDGLPRKRDPIRVLTAFLHPDGRISHFFIPFHALSISSTAEKDINAQCKVQQLLQDRPDGYLKEIIKFVEEIRNIQLKNLTIYLSLTSYDNALTSAECSTLLESLLDNAISMEKSQSLEQKLYVSRLRKLYQLTLLYGRDVRKATCSNSIDSSDSRPQEVDQPRPWTVESLAVALSLSEPSDELISVFRIVRNECERVNSADSVPIHCSDFIQCFDLEGELNSGSRQNLRLKKDLSPTIQTQMNEFFCRLCAMPDAKELLVTSGVAIGEVFETILLAFVRTPSYTIESLSNIKQSFIVLLSIREGSDDRTVTCLQDISKRILLKSNISTSVLVLSFIWMNALSQSNCPQIYVSEWSRRLHQASSFIELTSCLRSLLKDVLQLNYSLSDVFDSGNGRVSEIVCKWLTKMGSNSLNISGQIDGFRETSELQLVTKCAEFFPKSMDSSILVIHLAWEELQRWQRDRDDLELLETAILSLSSIACLNVRVRFMHLIWRSFFAKLFRDVVKRTDDFRKTTLNETLICDKELGIKRENVASLFSLLLSLLDQILNLVRLDDPLNESVELEYDGVSLNQQMHLLDHIKNTSVPDIDILSMEQQFASVLFLTWKLKLPSRPLKIFNSIEVNNLLSIQSTAIVSWFSDYNASVKRERIEWIELVCETATGHIHRLPDNKLDTTDYRKYIDIALQLGRVWFMSDCVVMNQCQALYKSGFDNMGAEIRSSLTELGKLADLLLEIALFRLSKYICQDEDAGRFATVPSDVVTEITARRDKASNVADTSLAATLTLLLWLTDNLEGQDLQLLATQCVSAVQVLQVRRNRLGD